jgi:hypothetical protein
MRAKYKNTVTDGNLDCSANGKPPPKKMKQITHQNS